MSKRSIFFSSFVALCLSGYLLLNNFSRLDTPQENSEYAMSRLEHYLSKELDEYSITVMTLDPNYPKKKIDSLQSLFSNEDVWVYDWNAQNGEGLAKGKVVISASGRTTIFGENGLGNQLGTRSY